MLSSGLLWQEPNPPRQRGGAPPNRSPPPDKEDMARANYFATLPVGRYLRFMLAECTYWHILYYILHTPLMESTHFWFHSQHFNCSKVVNYFWSEKSLRFKINCFNNSWFVNSDLIDTKNVNFVQIAFI